MRLARRAFVGFRAGGAALLGLSRWIRPGLAATMAARPDDAAAVAGRVTGSRPAHRGGDGRFDALLLPVGACEPRWFMRPVHPNPEETVQTYRDLRAQGTVVGMLWGTWQPTDEDPLDPPQRTSEAWMAAALPAERLFGPRHGETWEG